MRGILLYTLLFTGALSLPLPAVSPIEHNLMEKVVYLPRRLPSMHVSRLGQLRYVDAAYPSDYLNVVIGPSGLSNVTTYREARYITDHYREAGRPARWVQCPSDDKSLPEKLMDCGWNVRENLTGLIMDLNNFEQRGDGNVKLPDIEIYECGDTPCFQVYADILGRSLGGGGNADALRHHYGLLADIYQLSRNNLMMGLVFGPDDTPIGTACLFIRDGVAGIYEVTLLPPHGSAERHERLVGILLELAKTYDARNVVMLRPSMEEERWTAFGFEAHDTFVVWEHPVAMTSDEL